MLVVAEMNDVLGLVFTLSLSDLKMAIWKVPLNGGTAKPSVKQVPMSFTVYKAGIGD